MVSPDLDVAERIAQDALCRVAELTSPWWPGLTESDWAEWHAELARTLLALVEQSRADKQRIERLEEALQALADLGTIFSPHDWPVDRQEAIIAGALVASSAVETRQT